MRSVNLWCHSPYNNTCTQWWKRVFCLYPDKIAGYACWCRVCDIRLSCRAIRPFRADCR